MTAEGTNAVFSFAGGAGMQNNTITFGIAHLSNPNNFISITAIPDTGSDVVLIKREDGIKLGARPETNQNRFMVGGVGAGGIEFARYTSLIKFQNLPPSRFKFGVAVNPGALRENLLGREDILDVYDITFSRSNVRFSPRALAAMENGYMYGSRYM